MLRILQLLQTYTGRGVAWYAVSTVAESSRGFGTLTTLADSGAGCEVPHLLIETLPMGKETLLLYICMQACMLYAAGGRPAAAFLPNPDVCQQLDSPPRRPPACLSA